MVLTEEAASEGQTKTVDIDVATWGRLYEDHRAAMLRVATAGLRGARVNADPLEIVHEAFTSLMTNPPAHVDNWQALLVRATLFRVKDHLKRADQAHSSLTTEGTDDELEACEADASEDIAEQVVRQAHAAGVRARLIEVLSGLSAQQREVARRRIFEDQAVTVMAAEMGTSWANISKLLRKALIQIVTVLQDLDVASADIDDLQRTRHKGGGS
jgi:RNA polymerase sigma factor (sigma-70 family)